MTRELSLDERGRLRLAQAFRASPRVDCGIDSAIEGHGGRVLVDDPDDPHVFAINVGPFWYLAGNSNHPAAGNLLARIPPHSLLMPSPRDWIAAAERVLADRLEGGPRFSFSADRLSEAHLAHLVDTSPHRHRLKALDADLVASLGADDDGFLEFDGFLSPGDFLARGFGYVAIDGTAALGFAYTSLVHSRGVEVSVFVEERHRRRGVATAVASQLVRECLARGLRPNWDAANPESSRLAEKLGFVPSGTYLAFYLRP